MKGTGPLQEDEELRGQRGKHRKMGTLQEDWALERMGTLQEDGGTAGGWGPPPPGGLDALQRPGAPPEAPLTAMLCESCSAVRLRL